MTTYLGAKHWKPAVLQDLVFLQRGFDITKAQQKLGDVPVFSSAGLSSWHNEAKAQGPGVIIGRKGTLGSVHYSEDDYWPHDTTLWSKSFRGNSARYVYYALKCLGLERFNVGGANPTLNRNHIHGLPIYIPERSLQDDVVSILSAYDDLIENNRRRIALLEEEAQLLYREWFVHFRFPRHEHVKIIEGIPAGWKRRTLVELAEIVMGQSPKSQFYNEAGEGLPFHQGVTDYGFRFVSHRIYSSAVTKIAEAGDILVSVRAPVGRINIARERIVLGRGLAAIRSRTEHQSFLLYALKNHFYAEDIIGTGAIYAATNKKELEGQIFLEPSALLLREFEDQANTIDLQIACLTNQSDNLVRARDLLLPRLMNGETAV